ncbi:MAG: beta-methylgalactoside transporter [Angelakisella sp.]
MEATQNKFSTKSITKLMSNNSITVLLILLALFVAITQDNFMSKSNFVNLVANTSVRFVIALGVSGCLITKGTDLSAGRIAGLGACIASLLLQRPDYASRFWPNMPEMSVPFVLLITLAICAVFGVINGCVNSFLKVPPFIATLGMQTVVYGICLLLTGAQPIGGLKESYTTIANGSWFNKWVPYLLVIAAIVGAYMYFLYNKTRHGKYMYAIGGNENAAEVAGVNCNKTKILIYTLAACLYALGGFLMAAKTGGASVNTGQGYELEAIAACTIGGVSTNGGVGRVSGILIGVLVFETLKICLQFLGVEPSYTYIIQGLVIIVAVALDLRKYLAKK